MLIKHKFNPDKLFFTADNHFFHERIIEYCNRPFKDSDDQNQQLINNWNSVVPKDADVIIGGDFIHSGNIENVFNLTNSLNGRKWHILGNHCFQNRLDRDIFKDLFEWQGEIAMIEVVDTEYVQPTKFFISHYPHLAWPKGTINLHGHIHSGPKSTSNEQIPFHPLRYDIGVDNNLYKPISYKELMIIINNQIKLANEQN